MQIAYYLNIVVKDTISQFFKKSRHAIIKTAAEVK